jgi:type I restriction enzyme M protein
VITGENMARGLPSKNSDTRASEEQSPPESQITLERDLFLAADKLRKNLEPSD